MTREEAIEVLTDMRRIRSNTITEACDMAISALHFEADCRSCMWREKYEEQTEPSDFIRQETIKELGDWLEQMIQHGVPSHSAKRKALANAIALLSMDTHEIHTETHECVKETHDSDLISRADAVAYPLGFDHYDKENGSREFICGVESYREYIQHLPSVSAERVGEWELCKDIDGEYGICSVCGNDADFSHYGKPYHYCPNCGARMGNDDDDLDGLKIIAIIDGKGGAE